MLSSLIIKNFRLLEDFQVEKLGRVNLIVGKNNSGKSSVLEALRIYAGNGHPNLLEKIAQSHNERYCLNTSVKEGSEISLPYEDLFTGRQFPAEDKPIVIGARDNSHESLKISHVYRVEKNEIDPGTTEKMKALVTSLDDARSHHMLDEGLMIKKNGESTYLDFSKPESRWFIPLAKPLACSYIPTQIIASNELANDWDSIALTDAEETVKQAMQFITSEFEKLTFVNDSNSSDRQLARRIAKVKLTGLARPVPLNSLGDGMMRILQIALKLITAKGGFLLIDEFDNGLHYSVQEKVWALLFEMAQKLDIQIFATTHSWDCIESFAKIAIENQDVEGLLFRVGQSVRNRDKGRVIATVFEKEQLFSITQADVEVR